MSEPTGAVLWITSIVIPLLALLLPYANKLMKRFEEREEAERKEEEAAQDKYERLYRRHVALREQFERTRTDTLRALDMAILRLEAKAKEEAEWSSQAHRVATLLGGLKERLETLRVPGLEDD